MSARYKFELEFDAPDDDDAMRLRDLFVEYAVDWAENVGYSNPLRQHSGVWSIEVVPS